MAGNNQTFTSGYVFGIRSRKAFGSVAGKRQSSAETKDGDDLLGLNERAGQHKNQFLLSMMHAGTQPGCH